MRIDYFAQNQAINKRLKSLSKNQVMQLSKSIRQIAEILLSQDTTFESGDYYRAENSPIKIGDDYYIITIDLTIYHLDKMIVEFDRFDKSTQEECEAINKSNMSSMLGTTNNLKS